MALHLIPDDGAPHAPTLECGCSVRPIRVMHQDGAVRRAWAHGLDLSDDDAWWLDEHVFAFRSDTGG